MAGTQPRASCRSLFKQLEILPVACQYGKAWIIWTNWGQGSLDNQTCVRMLSSDAVIDLGNGLCMITKKYWNNDAYEIYFKFT